MPYTYILECVDGSYYTGSTWELEKRLWEHQQGIGARHTAKRLPVKLIYFEEAERIDDAYRREKQIQQWTRKKKEALISSEVNLLHELAECQNETHYEKFHALLAAVRLRSPNGSERIDSSTTIESPNGSASTKNELSRCLSVVEGNIWSESDVVEPQRSGSKTRYNHTYRESSGVQSPWTSKPTCSKSASRRAPRPVRWRARVPRRKTWR
jgi:putative endonuclease